MPTGGSGGEFERFISKYDSVDAVQNVPAFAPSGYLPADSAIGLFGDYFSSTAMGSNGTSAFFFLEDRYYSQIEATGGTWGLLSAAILYLFREAYHFIESGKTYRSGADLEVIAKALKNYPFSLIFSGNVNYSSGNNAQKTYSAYWNNAARSKANSSFLNFSNSYFGPISADPKDFGFSVRCVDHLSQRLAFAYRRAWRRICAVIYKI